MSGTYSAGSGYKWLIETHEETGIGLGIDHDEAGNRWGWIWKLRAPFKVCFLIWLIARDALPTNSLRYRRRMAESPTCSRCRLYPESEFHCLRDCYYARRVWNHLGMPAPGHGGGQMEPGLWVRRLVEAHGSVALAAIWVIWVSRNKAVFGGQVIPVDALHRWVDSLQDEFQRAWPMSPVQRPVRLVSWKAPSDGEIAVNCDGSKGSNPNSSGFGGCLRNSCGDWIRGFYGFGGSKSVLTMELLAIFHGLKVAWNEGFRRVLCLSDSLLAVSLIMDRPSRFHECAVIIASINELLRREWEVRLEHTLREGNACADYLAKAGAAQEQALHVVVDPPPELSLLLLADKSGTVFVRE